MYYNVLPNKLAHSPGESQTIPVAVRNKENAPTNTIQSSDLTTC